MKKLLLTLAIAIFLIAPVTASASDWKFYIMGVDLDLIKDKNWAKFTLGAVASITTHVAGHYIAAGLTDANMHQQGLREVVTDAQSLTDSDHRWIARSGFALQSLVNTALTSFKATRKLKFTQGYTLMTLAEISTYSMRWSDEGDFNYLRDNGGNKGRELNAFCLIAAYNTFRTIGENQWTL